MANGNGNPRELLIMTREGVRRENPLLTTRGGYYPDRSVRTPALRKEADDLLKNSGMKVQGKVSVPSSSPKTTPQNAVPQYKKGGMVKRTGMAKLHKGERILSKKQAKKVRK